MKILSSILISISLLQAANTYAADTRFSDDELLKMSAKMLMVGFKGDSITPDNPVNGYLKDLGVGGIILFDVDLTGDRTLGSRNITTAERLTKLTSDLRKLAGGRVLIAADQEGGRVQRLKPRYGYSPLPSARKIGEIDNRDTTIHYGKLMADELAAAGINVNLAPELDIHRDDCPVIGELDRAYSSDVEKVAYHAGLTVDCLHDKGILAAVKHFPGHGSATSDSHYGLTDVTTTWTQEELIPFKRLIDNGQADLIMTAHIFNRQLDPDMPATLSHRVLTDLLRNQLGFKGIILSDDMYMQGIIDNYRIEDAVVDAINAGADMLIMGNNITTGFEADRPARIAHIIVQAVKEGRIDPNRLVESNQRIDAAIDRVTRIKQ
ncbi:MAG: beta-N-acetylhexosaminidase [Muribaculaceae bacterium]|nr:beta-N-acetylhexosaminidase [Muribaculaceae bacterium]